ncbi:uncharacterized protein LOC118429959 isoform X1 [Branchiostoma floridae]|uniref:Uncharacterized protein LOC118429959 isoform X1 n=1 Tax=Branchiostoma floridae TaxID=7739 RepID=A0A9J7M852_BRAFL|nr:uncharacterized protein LOC118429959 isoform X1 [Branchiostoma floridae]
MPLPCIYEAETKSRISQSVHGSKLGAHTDIGDLTERPNLPAMALKLVGIFILSAFAVFLTEARSMGGFGSGPSGLGGPGAGFSLSDLLQNEDVASSFLGGVASTDPEQLELPFLTAEQADPEQLELFSANQDWLHRAAGPKIFDGKK